MQITIRTCADHEDYGYFGRISLRTRPSLEARVIPQSDARVGAMSAGVAGM